MMKNDKVEMNCSCRFTAEQLQRLSPEQLKAFMGGIGLVIAAQNQAWKALSAAPEPQQ